MTVKVVPNQSPTLPQMKKSPQNVATLPGIEPGRVASHPSVSEQTHIPPPVEASSPAPESSPIVPNGPGGEEYGLFIKGDLDAPVIGDTYRRNKTEAVVIDVLPNAVIMRVTDAGGAFIRTMSANEFRKLERATLKAGAEFIPARPHAPCDHKFLGGPACVKCGWSLEQGGPMGGA